MHRSIDIPDDIRPDRSRTAGSNAGGIRGVATMNGATIIPGGVSCEHRGCEATRLLALVDPDTDEDEKTLCPQHRVRYLREVLDE